MYRHRERIPAVLELLEPKLLISKLSLWDRTLVLLVAGMALRVSKLLALRWQDVKLEDLELV